MQSAVLDRVAIPAPSKIRSLPNLKTMAFVGAGLTVALGGSWYGTEWWQVGRFIEATDDAYAGGNVTSVSPHVAGFIAEIPVSDNQHVATGQLLIRLDARDFRAALDRTQAIADERQATLAGLEAKYVLQQQLIAKAEAELSATAAKAAFAREDAVRYHNLAATSYGSRQNAERATASDREAQSATKAARGRARRRAAADDRAATEIAAARAGIAQAKADIANRPPQSRLHRNPRADRRHCRQSRRAGRRLCDGRRAILLSVSRRTGSGSTPISRKTSSRACARASRRRSSPTCCRASLSTAMSRAWRRRPARCSACCRRRTPPATSPRSCSACRCASRSTMPTRRLGRLRPGLSTTVSVDTAPVDQRWASDRDAHRHDAGWLRQPARRSP